MKNIKRLVIAFVLTLPVLPAFSQVKTDSIYEFRFKPRNDMFFGVFRSNETQLKDLAEFVNSHRAAINEGAMPLYVDGYCSSRNAEAKNLATAKIRSNRVKSELITRLGLKEQDFITHNHSQDGDYVNVRIVWAQSQNATSEEVRSNEPTAATTEQVESVEKVERTETVKPADSAEQAETAEPATILSETKSEEIITDKVACNSHISLRANLLRLATLTPDLGIEWQFANRWSVVVDGSWTSWSWDNKNRRYALWEVSPEVRYYFSESNKFYVGAQYKIGEFNYKLSDTGKQGDLQGGGITFGYKLPLGKSFALDFNVGAGCLHTHYETYHVTDGVRVKDGDHTKNVWGVTDLGVTLVWKLK